MQMVIIVIQENNVQIMNKFLIVKMIQLYIVIMIILIYNVEELHNILNVPLFLDKEHVIKQFVHGKMELV